MSMEDLADLLYADQKEVVINQTFGHLASVPGRVYFLTAWWASSEGGVTTLIKTDLGDLLESPWLFMDLMKFIGDYAEKVPQGTLWKFTGAYRKFKNGRAKFTGAHREILLQ
jgi:hypothetical protein